MNREELTEEQQQKNLTDALNQFFYMFSTMLALNFCILIYRATAVENLLFVAALFFFGAITAWFVLLPIKLFFNIPEIDEKRFRFKTFIDPRKSRAFVVASLMLACNVTHVNISTMKNTKKITVYQNDSSTI